jgi:hypothetical protein
LLWRVDLYAPKIKVNAMRRSADLCPRTPAASGADVRNAGDAQQQVAQSEREGGAPTRNSTRIEMKSDSASIKCLLSRYDHS